MTAFRLILVLIACCAYAAPAAAQVPGPAAFSVSDVQVTERDDDTVVASFTVTRSGDSTLLATVNYNTGDGTAAQPGDYTQVSGSLTFAPGDPPEKTVTVPIGGDTEDERPSETFKLFLNGAVGATIEKGEGVGTILDDDPKARLSITGDTVVEGDSGQINAVFRLALDQAAPRPVTLQYNTADLTAARGEDYDEATGSVTFDPGETEKAVSVPVRGDKRPEGDESFAVQLTNVQNALVDNANASGLIRDDEQGPTARLTVSPTNVFTGQVVVFDGSGSTDPEGRQLQYRWDLDSNGSFETSTGTESELAYVFFQSGAQSARLRVTDDEGLSDDVTAVTQVATPLPTAQVPPDKTAPSARILGRVSRSLRAARRRGVRVRLRCSEACIMGATVGVDRRTGRRIGLRGRSRTLGRASSATTAAGSKVLAIKLSRRARRALSDVRRVRVTLRFTVRDPSGNRRVFRRTITLRN